MSAGSVLQVVHNSSGSDVALTNDLSTFSDAVAASITPRATSSSCAGDVHNGNYRAMRYRIARAISGATSTIYERNYHMYDSNVQNHNIDTQNCDSSPSTTSAITFTYIISSVRLCCIRYLQWIFK